MKTTDIFAAALMLGVIALPSVGRAQVTDEEVQALRVMATPFGALPPAALPMPASRNHNYLSYRLLGGYRKGPSGTALPGAAAGIDFQYHGGSVFGLTGGMQKRDCKLPGSDCGTHPLFGARAQLGLVTGGSTMSKLLRDNSTTSTFGAEIGFGYAPNVRSGINACTIDAGIPYSVAKRRQRPRLVAFVTPGIVWDLDCSSSGPATRKSYTTGFGIGLQQVGNRSLDLQLGFQKIYREGTGMQFGVSATYVRLP